MEKLNPIAKAEWVKALESGEYKQGHGRLRDNDTFCCLGVLCDVYRKATGNGNWGPSRVTSRKDAYSFLGADFGLPKEVSEWAGIPADDVVVENPVVLGDDESTTSLIAMNDAIKYASFVQIAAVIREQL